MLNSGMERITDIGTLLSRFQENEEETMVTRFHGIDRHKKYSTVSVLDREGRGIRFLRSCQMEAYLAELGPVFCAPPFEYSIVARNTHPYRRSLGRVPYSGVKSGGSENATE